MRISDWSSDVCSADLCRGFSGCSCCCAIAGTAVDRHSNINAALQLCIMFLQPACGCELYMSHLRAKRVIFPLQRRLSGGVARSEEHTSELQSLMRISYAVFFLTKKKKINTTRH